MKTDALPVELLITTTRRSTLWALPADVPESSCLLAETIGTVEE